MNETSTNVKEAAPKRTVMTAEPGEMRVRRPNRAKAWFRGWSNEYLSRENVTAIVKTLLWVVPLTLLIWIYAERQQQDEAEITMPVEIVSTDPTKVFSIQSPASKNIVVKVRGPKAALETARRAFDPLSGNQPGKISFQGSAGAKTSIKADRIREDKRLSDAGITVESVKPDEIEVWVDQLVEADYPIQVSEQLRSGRISTFKPDKVKLRGPARILNNPSAPLRVEADVAAQLNKFPPSDQPIKLKDVKLNLIGADNANITMTPTVADAEVTPVKAKEATLGVVRVMIAASKSTLDRYVIEIPTGETIPNVLVSGPEEVIDKMTGEGTSAPIALLEIPSIISEGETEVPIRYDLPPGVELKDDRTKLRIRVTPR